MERGNDIGRGEAPRDAGRPKGAAAQPPRSGPSAGTVESEETSRGRLPMVDAQLDTAALPPLPWGGSPKERKRKIEVHRSHESSVPGWRPAEESFEEAVNRITNGIASNSVIGDRRLVTLGSRPLTGGILSRTWNSSIFSKLWRDISPSESFDVRESGALSLDDTRCRVTISQALFSKRITVSVKSYPGGEGIAKKIEGLFHPEVAGNAKRVPVREPTATGASPAVSSCRAGSTFDGELGGHKTQGEIARDPADCDRSHSREPAQLSPVDNTTDNRDVCRDEPFLLSERAERVLRGSLFVGFPVGIVLLQAGVVLESWTLLLAGAALGLVTHIIGLAFFGDD